MKNLFLFFSLLALFTTPAFAQESDAPDEPVTVTEEALETTTNEEEQEDQDEPQLTQADCNDSETLLNNECVENIDNGNYESVRVLVNQYREVLCSSSFDISGSVGTENVTRKDCENSVDELRSELIENSGNNQAGSKDEFIQKRSSVAIIYNYLEQLIAKKYPFKSGQLTFTPENVESLYSGLTDDQKASLRPRDRFFILSAMLTRIEELYCGFQRRPGNDEWEKTYTGHKCMNMIADFRISQGCQEIWRWNRDHYLAQNSGNTPTTIAYMQTVQAPNAVSTFTSNRCGLNPDGLTNIWLYDSEL